MKLRSFKCRNECSMCCYFISRKFEASRRIDIWIPSARGYHIDCEAKIAKEHAGILMNSLSSFRWFITTKHVDWASETFTCPLHLHSCRVLAKIYTLRKIQYRRDDWDKHERFNVIYTSWCGWLKPKRKALGIGDRRMCLFKMERPLVIAEKEQRMLVDSGWWIETEGTRSMSVINWSIGNFGGCSLKNCVYEIFYAIKIDCDSMKIDWQR